MKTFNAFSCPGNSLVTPKTRQAFSMQAHIKRPSVEYQERLAGARKSGREKNLGEKRSRTQRRAPLGQGSVPNGRGSSGF